MIYFLTLYVDHYLHLVFLNLYMEKTQILKLFLRILYVRLYSSNANVDYNTQLKFLNISMLFHIRITQIAYILLFNVNLQVLFDF